MVIELSLAGIILLSIKKNWYNVMNRIDAILGIIFIVFSLISLVFIVPSQTFSFGYGDGLSPSFFPNAILIVLCGLSVLLVVTNIMTFRTSASRQPFSVRSYVNFIWIVLITIGACVGMYCLGFLLSSPLIIVATMLLMGETGRLRIISYSIACPIFIYLIFAIILKKQLPLGIIFS